MHNSSYPRNEWKTKIQHLHSGWAGGQSALKRESGFHFDARHHSLSELESNRDRMSFIANGRARGVAPFVRMCDRQRRRRHRVLPLCFATTARVTCACASCTWLLSSHLLACLARRTLHPPPSVRRPSRPPLPFSRLVVRATPHLSSRQKNWLFLNISHRVGWVWMCVRVYYFKEEPYFERLLLPALFRNFDASPNDSMFQLSKLLLHPTPYT